MATPIQKSDKRSSPLAGEREKRDRSIGRKMLLAAGLTLAIVASTLLAGMDVLGGWILHIGPIPRQDAPVEINETNVTLGDKLLAAKLALSNLSEEDLRYLLSLSFNGLTDAELITAHVYIRERLSSADRQILLRLYRKYGL